jgi:hypothetical protein
MEIDRSTQDVEVVEPPPATPTDAPPVGEIGRKVEVGFATIGGYVAGTASAGVGIAASAAELPLPDHIKAILIVIGGVLVAITNIGRYMQAYKAR